MCCISASKSVERLKAMIRAGSDRAGHSYSITVFGKGTSRYMVTNSAVDEILESIDYAVAHGLIVDGSTYVIVHQQAPTTSERTMSSVHPAYLKVGDHQTLLWHNGIIKDDSVRDLQSKYNSTTMWDTMLLSHAVGDLVLNSNQSALSRILGGFACMYSVDGQQLWAFRNSVCPLYFNDDLDISSVKVGDMKEIKENRMMMIIPDTDEMHDISSFKNHETSYLFL